MFFVSYRLMRDLTLVAAGQCAVSVVWSMLRLLRKNWWRCRCPCRIFCVNCSAAHVLCINAQWARGVLAVSRVLTASVAARSLRNIRQPAWLWLRTAQDDVVAVEFHRFLNNKVDASALMFLPTAVPFELMSTMDLNDADKHYVSDSVSTFRRQFRVASRRMWRTFLTDLQSGRVPASFKSACITLLIKNLQLLRLIDAAGTSDCLAAHIQEAARPATQMTVFLLIWACM